MRNDKRITIRLPDDLHAWVEGEAAALALDSAAFVRMSLQQRRNGHENVTIRAAAPGRGDSVTDLNDAAAELPATEPGPASPDDLVAKALASAEATGATSPRQAEEDYPEFGGSVRPVGPRRIWDPYNAKERARA